MAENDHLPLTWHIALTTVYALTCYTVILAKNFWGAGPWMASTVERQKHITAHQLKDNLHRGT